MSSKTINIGVTGGRDYPYKNNVWRVLDRAYDIICSDFAYNMLLKVGDARGTDQWAIEWFQEKFSILHKPFLYMVIFNADWYRYGPAAGPIRNKQMADSGINVLYAFPGGAGTENMKILCRQNGIIVKEIE